MEEEYSQYLTSPVLAGVNLDFWIQNLDDYIGITKVKQTIIFNDQPNWERNNTVLYLQFGANAGYSIIDKKNVKIVPVGGVGVTFLTLLGGGRSNKYACFSIL